jgi:hypothetical protein
MVLRQWLRCNGTPTRLATTLARSRIVLSDQKVHA